MYIILLNIEFDIKETLKTKMFEFKKTCSKVMREGNATNAK